MKTASSIPLETGPSRRDFLYLATAMAGGVGTAVAVWPFIDQMRPSADVLAVSLVEIDLAGIEPGQRVTFQWRGRPVFVDRRTPEAVQEARSVPLEDLKDPERDDARTLDPQWLVVVGVCTHLGCVPLGQAEVKRPRRLGRLVLPMPWIPLRHVGTNPPRPRAAEPGGAAVRVRHRHHDPDRMIRTNGRNTMNIGHASDRSGLPTKTIRYYEDIGLVSPDRGPNGYRDYSDSHVHILRFLQRARALGFSIEECRELLGLYGDKGRASADVKAIASAKLAEIDEKIRALGELRATLETLVRHCHGDERPECPIIENLAEQGFGQEQSRRRSAA